MRDVFISIRLDQLKCIMLLGRGAYTLLVITIGGLFSLMVVVKVSMPIQVLISKLPLIAHLGRGG